MFQLKDYLNAERPYFYKTLKPSQAPFKVFLPVNPYQWSKPHNRLDFFKDILNPILFHISRNRRIMYLLKNICFAMLLLYLDNLFQTTEISFKFYCLAYIRTGVNCVTGNRTSGVVWSAMAYAVLVLFKAYYQRLVIHYGNKKIHSSPTV